MSITINIRYTGENGNARKFAEEMERTGTADAIRAEAGNIRYEYYFPMNHPETVLLIDAWEDQNALDIHHASPMMAAIAALREKYDLHMTVERFISAEENAADEAFIREFIASTEAAKKQHLFVFALITLASVLSIVFFYFNNNL